MYTPDKTMLSFNGDKVLVAEMKANVFLQPTRIRVSGLYNAGQVSRIDFALFPVIQHLNAAFWAAGRLDYCGINNCCRCLLNLQAVRCKLTIDLVKQRDPAQGLTGDYRIGR